MSAVPSPHPAFEPYAYSIKRHGLTLANCDSEPVQTPACVQAHGALLVLRLSDLRISQASENAEAVLQQAAEKLLGKTIDSVIGKEGANRLRPLLDKQPVDCNPLYVMTLPAGNGLETLSFEDVPKLPV